MPAADPSLPLATLRTWGVMALAGLFCMLAAGAAGAAMIGTGLAPQVVATADLNEDGYVDLISCNSGDSTVSVSLGRGNGQFEPRAPYACASPPTSIAIADLNGDGHLDIAVTCPGVAKARIRFGTGDGTLGAPTDYSVAAPVAIVATNFNNQTDALTDLVVLNSTGAAMNYLRNDGGGAFTVLAGYTSVYRSVHLAAGDVDSDGRPDLVMANVADSVAIFRGSGNGAFFAPIQRYKLQGVPASVALADFNQDGKPDIVATIPSANAVNVLLGNGDTTFGPYTSFPAGSSPQHVATGNFNGDGAPDLAVTGGSTTVTVLIGTGSGGFQPQVGYSAFIVGPTDIAAAPLDGDATTDLAVAASSQNSICTLPGNGNGTFQVPPAPTYVWTTGTAALTDPAAWTPTRNTPTASDVLILNRGGGFGVVGAVGSVGQIVLSGGSTPSFSAVGFGTGTLTVLGGAGTDFMIEKGSSLNLTSFVSPLQIGIAAGANAQIDGDLILGSANNRFQALSSNGIIFQSTGRAFLESGATTPFGNGTGASALNSVKFLYGSQCNVDAPVQVFGTAAPNAVVIFGPGSRYRQTVAFSPDVSGRTYGDFEYDAQGTGSVMSGSGAFQVDSLIVTAGTLTSEMTGPFTIRGNVAVGCYPSIAHLNFLPASPMTVRFGGTALQVLRNNSNCASVYLFYAAPNVTLNIDNPAGIYFQHGFWTSASLLFTKGNVTSALITSPGVPAHGLNHYRVVIDSTGTVLNAGPSTGWFTCMLMRRVAGNGSMRFDVGDAVSYQPMDVTFHGVTGPGYMICNTSNEDHWDLANAQLDMVHLAHRSWRLWAADDPAGNPATWLASADATLAFAPGDVTSGSDPLQFVPRILVYGSGWTTATVGGRTSTSIELLGIPLSDLFGAYVQAGEPITPTMVAGSATASEGNGPTPTRVRPAAAQTAGSLTFHVSISQAAIDPVTVDYHTVDGSATVADGDYTPQSGTLTFAPGDTAKNIVVPFGVDATPERNETFGLQFSNATGATLTTPSVTGTILDDDDVTPPTAAVVYPNGGETVYTNSLNPTVTLQWTASDNVAVSGVDLFISRDNGKSYQLLQSNYSNTGSYDWIATGPNSSQMRFQVIAHDDPGHSFKDASNAAWSLVNGPTSVDDAPLAFALAPITPNPMPAGRARIGFALPHAARVRLTILDVQGRTVATLADGELAAGRHERTWEGSARAAAGLYFVRLEAPGFRSERRMTLLR